MPNFKVCVNFAGNLTQTFLKKIRKKHLQNFFWMPIIGVVLNGTVPFMMLNLLTPYMAWSKIMKDSTKKDSTAKRTRNVIKWQAAHETVTCSMIALFLDNKDVETSKLAMVGRKVQLVLESIAQTVKDGKPSKDIEERRDNLALALSVAGITNSNVVEALDKFVALFDGVCHEV